ncbi:hypothetical protein EJB05_08968, partial [Eragrostis curvula]
MTRSQFEASPYLKHNRLTILCTVTVRKKPHTLPSTLAACWMQRREQMSLAVLEVRISEHKGSCLLPGHLYSKQSSMGPCEKAKFDHITTEDLEPAVFRALLHLYGLVT